MTPTSSFRVADDSFMTRQLDKEPICTGSFDLSALKFNVLHAKAWRVEIHSSNEFFRYVANERFLLTQFS